MFLNNTLIQLHVSCTHKLYAQVTACVCESWGFSLYDLFLKTYALKDDLDVHKYFLSVSIFKSSDKAQALLGCSSQPTPN